MINAALTGRVSRYVERHPGCDAGEVRLAVHAVRGATDRVLGQLERAGLVERRSGRYRSLKPYRSAEALLSEDEFVAEVLRVFPGSVEERRPA